MSILFREALLDPDIILATNGQTSPVTGFPEFQNEHAVNQKTGVYKTNIGRLDGLEMLNVDLQLLDDTKRKYFINFYRAGFGSGIGFRFRIPYDYIRVEEAFATSDHTKTSFNLYTTYISPGTNQENVRRVIKPVVQQAKEKNSFQLLTPDGTGTRVIANPFKIFLDSGSGITELTTGWTVDCKTGIVYFTSAPLAGTLYWSGEFDIAAAFLPATPQQKYDFVSSVSSVGIREMPCSELGIAY